MKLMTLIVDGKKFTCERGCNVFYLTKPHNGLKVYTCNNEYCYNEYTADEPINKLDELLSLNLDELKNKNLNLLVFHAKRLVDALDELNYRGEEFDDVAKQPLSKLAQTIKLHEKLIGELNGQ
jgi:hypothetical protein